MHEILEELVNETADTFGLDSYYLKRHSIFRQTDDFQDTFYILSMEWFPKNNDQTDEDINPPGTAVIDMDIHSKKVKRVIFVEDVTFAEQSGFPDADTENAIEWVEELTGLEFGRQFKLMNDDNYSLYFQAAVDNVPVYPSGIIEVKFNADGKLILFSIDGVFPHEEQINWEPFDLTPESTAPLAKEQVQLLQIPIEDEKKWLAVYGTTTIFLTNDGKRTISFEEVENQGSYVKKDLPIEWETTDVHAFKAQDYDLSVDVTIEQALRQEADPDTLPLTETDQKKASQEVRNFIQREFPADNGKWRLTALYRENGYIFADIKPAEGTNRVIERKLRIILDRENFHAVDYLDNSIIVDIFNRFQESHEVKLSKDEAFDKLYDYIEVTPVYVYDKEKGAYILCGKIDCGYAVDGFSGELVLLDEL
ncbi:hypothetical protein [Virgibacillus ainsalahensis]